MMSLNNSKVTWLGEAQRGGEVVAKPRRPIEMQRSDEEYRLQSPAYRPDDDWDVLEPQGMQVVLSVRFDARTARSIAHAARQTGQTPSGLIRSWTQERVAAIDHEEPAAGHAIGEAASTYVVGGDVFEVLRSRYRPTTIRILLVGESPPSGGTFFYLANSRLFFATQEAFTRARGPAPSGSAFLELLKEEGIWLFDLSAAPVNRLSGRPRREAVESRASALVDLLREIDPPRVVAIKRSLEPIVRAAMGSAGIGLNRLQVLPFPLYQWREEYVAGLATILRGLTPQAMPSSADLAAGHSPRRDRKSDDVDRGSRGRTQPVTDNDMASGQIRIPQEWKRLLPEIKGAVRIDLRGRQMQSTYDPRNGPDRSRSGVLRIPKRVLASVVQPHEGLQFVVHDERIALT
jgi:hypothetical protein